MNYRQGEDFVKQFRHYLLQDNYINPTRPVEYEAIEDENGEEIGYIEKEKNVEGADWQSFSYTGSGDIEIKTIENYLTRGNDNDEPSGTVPFELFQATKKHQPDKRKWYTGWIGICNAFWYTLFRKEIREKQNADGKYPAEVSARTPNALVYVLLDAKGNPFACIAFEKIPELITRVCEICPDPAGFGLTDIDTQKPATDRKYWKQYETWNDEYGKVIGNMWHIPFRQIMNLQKKDGETINLPLVTMIGKDPEILETFTNSYGQTVTAELQRTRLNVLKEKAKERGAMSTLIPEKAITEMKEEGERASKLIGIPAERLHPVNIDDIRERYDNPWTLEEMKAVYDQAIRKHNEKTGDNLPTWDERNRRQMQKLQRIREQAMTKE